MQVLCNICEEEAVKAKSEIQFWNRSIVLKIFEDFGWGEVVIVVEVSKYFMVWIKTLYFWYDFSNI